MESQKESDIQREEDFKYRAAVCLHSLAEHHEPDELAKMLVDLTPYSEEEINGVLDMAYHLRLEM